MKKNADVVIIGGGIIGMAVAFYLAREKYGDIVLLEKEKFLGSWSTSKAAGGIRAQFSIKVNIEMSMLSERMFRQFENDTGYNAVFDQVGYMFLLSRDEDVEAFTRHVELQRSCGLDVKVLKPDEISQYAPHVRTDDLQMATLCLEDGLGDPHEFLSGYEHAARKMGVEIALETEVTGFDFEGGKITTVKTSQGDIEAPIVINAAGAFSGKIGEMAGTDVPVKPYRRQCVTTGPLDFVKPTFPMVVDVATGLYNHKESKGLLLGWADGSQESSFDVSIDPDYTDGILERALDRMPLLETAEVANVWAGLYETTPDHRGIIGYDPKVENLFHVTGFSGHGMMHAPAAGIVTMETLTGKPRSVDIADLAPTRFQDGDTAIETNVI
ncbi:FAD-dependent oxidoreductase [candidate division GN15 bacterium]|nr:FAD-dependent oxidoreductase [candidate division GN15 bacterium]